MASLTLRPPQPWAPGTTVSLYKGFMPSSGPPPGAPVTTAVVAGDYSLTFTGVQDGVSYFAYANGLTSAINAPAVAGAGPAVVATGPFTSSQVDGLIDVGQTLYELDALGNVVNEWVKA